MKEIEPLTSFNKAYHEKLSAAEKTKVMDEWKQRRNEGDVLSLLGGKVVARREVQALDALWNFSLAEEYVKKKTIVEKK